MTYSQCSEIVLTILLNIKSPYSDWFRSLRHLSFSETHFFIKSHIMNAGKIDLSKKSRDLPSVMHQIHGKLNGNLTKPKIRKNGNRVKFWALLKPLKNFYGSQRSQNHSKIMLVPSRKTFASIRYMGTFNVELLMGTCNGHL